MFCRSLFRHRPYCPIGTFKFTLKFWHFFSSSHTGDYIAGKLKEQTMANYILISLSLDQDEELSKKFEDNKFHPGNISLFLL